MARQKTIAVIAVVNGLVNEQVIGIVAERANGSLVIETVVERANGSLTIETVVEPLVIGIVAELANELASQTLRAIVVGPLVIEPVVNEHGSVDANVVGAFGAPPGAWKVCRGLPG